MPANPLHLAGNTTKEQRDELKGALDEAVHNILRTALNQIDRHSARLVLEVKDKLKAEIVSLTMKTIHRFTVSDKYIKEESLSRREYPLSYKVRPIEAQVTELKKHFPQLGWCMEKLARNPLPDGAEAWFAIPRWQALAPTYNEAVKILLDLLASKRRFDNRIVDKMGAAYLRQTERARLAETILAQQQPGSDILVVAAQNGLLHRGCSARRARVVMSTNEFALGAFAMGCILLTHPERLSQGDTLMIDCAGDEYSIAGDGFFDRVPLYDYDIGGIEFSIFYEDRARNLWGTPTAFMVQREPATETLAGGKLSSTSGSQAVAASVPS